MWVDTGSHLALVGLWFPCGNFETLKSQGVFGWEPSRLRWQVQGTLLPRSCLWLPLPGLSWLLVVWQKINAGNRWRSVINLSEVGWNLLACCIITGWERVTEMLGSLWLSLATICHPYLSLWVMVPGTFFYPQKLCILQYWALFSYTDHKSSDYKHWGLWETQDLEIQTLEFCEFESVRWEKFLKMAIAQLLPWWLSGKESTCDAGDVGSIPGLGRSPWRRKWQLTPLFLSGKSMDRRAWQTTVHGVAKELDMTSC